MALTRPTHCVPFSPAVHNQSSAGRDAMQRPTARQHGGGCLTGAWGMIGAWVQRPIACIAGLAPAPPSLAASTCSHSCPSTQGLSSAVGWARAAASNRQPRLATPSAARWHGIPRRLLPSGSRVGTPLPDAVRNEREAATTHHGSTPLTKAPAVALAHLIRRTSDTEASWQGCDFETAALDLFRPRPCATK